MARFLKYESSLIQKFLYNCLVKRETVPDHLFAMIEVSL